MASAGTEDHWEFKEDQQERDPLVGFFPKIIRQGNQRSFCAISRFEMDLGKIKLIQETLALKKVPPRTQTLCLRYENWSQTQICLDWSCQKMVVV